ncbi:MAG TPA: hypothetical protein VHD85_19915 [Terracidiphilus sp.]|nr:hypothetical protein [Terracidiphilus sp.]
MINQLRPLTLGEVLDRTAELYRTNFLLFAGISAIFAGATLITGLLQLGVRALLGYPHIEAKLQWAVATLGVVSVLIVLLVAGLSIAAITRAVAWIYLGEPTTIRAAVMSIGPRMGRYLWVMTIAGFRAWAPLAVVYIGFFAVIFTYFPKGFLTNPAVMQSAPAPNPAQALTMAIVFLILAPIFLLALVYGVIMSLRYSLAVPACVVEELPARQAIKRSIHLSKGTRGHIFVLGLLIGAVRMVLGILLGLPFIFYTFKHIGHAIPIAMLAFQQLAAFLESTLIGPIYSTGLTLFYYDQRVRKEGSDIEWMMRSAGLTTQAGLPAAEHS